MNQTTLPPAIFVMGPTASGKTDLAISLYKKLPIELISVDSALVYEDMNIGTAKPSAEELKQAPHALIDIIPPTEVYSAAHFRNDTLQLMADITARGKIPVLVGGTMLYFKALEEGLSQLPEADPAVRQQIEQEASALGWPAMHAKLALVDPESAARLQPNDVQRIERALEVYRITGKSMTALHQASSGDTLPYRLLKIALVPSDRKVLHARIALRFEKMLAHGFVDEVKALVRKYPALTSDSTSMRCVGYRQALEYLAGEYDATELRDRGIFATRQLAKRQLTWLRSMQDLHQVDCLDPQMQENVLNTVSAFIKESTSR
ncbi:tRNA (adenosine(37)-N6)-dimethylallyltransferase MiaA [Methylotenera mobilis]|uniref:tRNA dimethylallyltransferase n=1 Tax=Methylotenera mobilis (strain JLW8 / ATCC BAA-1282 / DSM 17540) TaxID=583345 RepID=C6WV05_METML|nr:tRNA (adenosine(37)-N6)-dimethylallyltransferase MiaA [Methylotenera mobilis]ACT47754.1 tRNA delta(2)-isopentenylpyrophosphate transferase [Methylotenera mobilis JLW8]